MQPYLNQIRVDNQLILEFVVEVELNRCIRTNRSISHDGTYRQAEVDRTDATLLVEELAEIYTTPTPKGLRKAEKSNWH